MASPFARLLAAILAGAAASAAVSSPLAGATRDAAAPHLAALRKDRAPDGPDAGPVETLATLFETHQGDLVALSSSEPESPRFAELLADRVTGGRIELDARLLGLLRTLAAGYPAARIELVSGYRHPKRNETMRKKGHHVASHSQHSLGRALDFRVAGWTPERLRAEIARTGFRGGLARYDGAGDRFVHADVGPPRAWVGR